MNGGTLVILPRGRAGEIFAQTMAKEMANIGGGQTVSFAYPYLPDYKENSEIGLVQQVAAVVRDAAEGGISEFLFADTGLISIVNKVPELLGEEVNIFMYDPVEEARRYFADPQERPLWFDRWRVMKTIEGFPTLYSQDRGDLRELIKEVVWRVRGVTGGSTEATPQELRKNIVSEEFLRTRAAQLLLKLAEIDAKKGILLGNIEMGVALTRYVDEEFRDYIEACKFINLAKVLAKRLA